MQYFLAIFPILVVLGVMVWLRWGGQRVGPIGWFVGLVIGFADFGLTPQALLVSQLKGLYLSFTVLLILWPALFLYYLVDRIGGIQAIAHSLKGLVNDHGLLVVMLAWSFASMLEGLAGFGLPIAVVSPMLVGLGVSPIIAVAATAVGHSWSVTFGDMGVVYQTLTSVTKMDGAALAPYAALSLGLACLACGLAAAWILKQGRLWFVIIPLAVVMAGVQYLLAVSGLTPMAGFGAGLAGVLAVVLISRLSRKGETRPAAATGTSSFALQGALAAYGSLACLMSVVALVTPVHDVLYSVALQAVFPEVATINGFVTASSTQFFRPLVHPGVLVILVALVSYWIYTKRGWCPRIALRESAAATWRSAAPASLGVISMIGLAMIMDHSGMTFLLARGVSQTLGAIFPVASPLVGILGAFATGSNNNSNVLFASLQQNAAILLGMDPRILLAAQTTGGALGSMLAPAKIIVGCSTVGMKGRDGEVLRRTLPFGLAIGLGIGLLALLFSRL
jgi:lactate permease